MLRVRGLTVAFGRQPILEDIDLDVMPGQFTSLIGPSGSGKTSILRAVTACCGRSAARSPLMFLSTMWVPVSGRRASSLEDRAPERCARPAHPRRRC